MTKKPLALLASAIFLLIAPGFVAGVVPWWISHWKFQQYFFNVSLFPVAGILLLALGSIGLLDSFVRFAMQGLGTPAPVLPTRRLVVSGLYRYVRNPMYVAVVSTILGQAFLFGNIRLLAYGAMVWLCFHAFVLAYEEPTLRATYGSAYESFCASVPRWVPRLPR